MRHLVGVHHSFNPCLLRGEHEGSVGSLYPSKKFIEWLEKFPKGTKVGLEQLGKEDFQIRKEHFSKLGKVIRDKYDSGYVPSYREEHGMYWAILKGHCEKLGFKIVYLEDLDTWFKYNKAMIDYWLLYAKYRTYFSDVKEEGKEGMKRCLRFEEALYRLDIRARKIHEIQRDDKLLEAIAASDIEIPIVGQGHSDFWIGDPEGVRQNHGIEFDSYSTDLASPNNFGGFDMDFRENVPTEQEMVFQRESLERRIRLVEQGRITDGTPDYVGTWDYEVPSKGYFEVFVNEKHGEKVSGFIQDCLGVATFEGKIDDRGLDFVKRYGLLSCKDAGFGDIRFQGAREGDDFYGRFNVRGKWGSVFCMVKAPKIKPLDLGIKLNKRVHENIEIFDQFKSQRDTGF